MSPPLQALVRPLVSGIHVARDVLGLILAEVGEYKVLRQRHLAREAAAFEYTNRSRVSRVAQGVKSCNRQVCGECYDRR
jgi:hypothetical protein